MPDEPRSHRCPLCGCTFPPVLLADTQSTTYHHCPSCDLIFAGERALPSPEEERNRYLQHDNTLDNEGYVNLLRGFLEAAVLPHVGEARGHVLDFGCGPGPVLGYLMREEGFAVRLYDPFFFPDEEYTRYTYDVITSTEVFEHLRCPAEVLRRLVRLLAPGGVLAIMTHLHPGPENFADWWYHRDPTHITFYSAATFRWVTEHFPLRFVAHDGDRILSFRRKAGTSRDHP